MFEMHSGHEVCFLCDQNLGKLAKWLRILGYDAEYMSCYDETLINDAVNSGRIFLTRRTSILTNKDIIFIEHDNVREQMKQLFKQVGLKIDQRPLSRCSRCNDILDIVSIEELKSNIPEFVYATNKYISICPTCKRTYWKGTHYCRISKMICDLQKEIKDE